VAEPRAFVRTTSTVWPAGPTGALQRRLVSFVTLTAEAARPPKVTVGGPAESFRKPLPVRVTRCCWLAPPSDGAIEIRVGAVW
jgi:hypothetical protein